MSEEMIQGLIDALSEKLGVASEVLWSALLRQAHIQAVAMLVTVVVVILLIAAFIFGAIKTKGLKNSDGIPLIHIGCLLLAAVTVMAMLMEIALGWIGNLATALFNPEYYAIQQLLDVLK